ncbi:hypothetical protein V8C44DRAFT_222772 [Trichoderma aethiopicum]
MVFWVSGGVFMACVDMGYAHVEVCVHAARHVSVLMGLCLRINWEKGCRISTCTTPGHQISLARMRNYTSNTDVSIAIIMLYDLLTQHAFLAL